MALIPVNVVGQYGIVRTNDVSPVEIPLNAWSAGQNVRMRDGLVEKFLGHMQVFGTPSTAPYFAVPLAVSGSYYWIYCSLTKAYVWDGSAHTDITRASGDYTANALKNWTVAVLGNIPVLNNGNDVPQQWLPQNPSTDLAPLANWDANHRCGAIQSFKRFLVALDITKSGTRYPQMVKWSHSATPGNVPASWDPADETKDAAEYELLDSDGALVDAVRMREDLIIYKDDSVYRMQFVGGIDIFRFALIFSNFGILSRRCAVEFAKGRHAVFAQGDLIVHDGVTWQSIISSRMRRWLFNQIDPTNAAMSFVGLNPSQYEVWFCFPSTGASVPNTAVTWNWNTNAIGVRDLEATHVANGNVFITSDTWDGDSADWNSHTAVWDLGTTNPAGERLLICDPVTSKLFWGDATNRFDGADMISYIERTGLPVPVKPDGPPDMRNYKFVKGIYPRLTGTIGAVVKVHLGEQKVPEGAVSWKPPKDYTIGTTRFIDVRVNAPLIAIKFESTGNFDWKLSGYELDVSPGGRF